MDGPFPSHVSPVSCPGSGWAHTRADVNSTRTISLYPISSPLRLAPSLGPLGLAVSVHALHALHPPPWGRPAGGCCASSIDRTARHAYGGFAACVRTSTYVWQAHVLAQRSRWTIGESGATPSCRARSGWAVCLRSRPGRAPFRAGWPACSCRDDRVTVPRAHERRTRPAGR